jgi:UPF0755 protein
MPIFFRRPFFIPVLVLSLTLLAHFFLSPPGNFPQSATFSIKKGSSLRHISQDLKKENIIRSRVAFEAFSILYGGEHHMVPGDYVFAQGSFVSDVARNIGEGKYGINLVKLTIPEGYNTSQIIEVASSKLTNFNAADFKAEAMEGYLFPDTYFLFPADGATQLLKAMNDNFERKIKLLEQDIILSGKSENIIITMASIVEREAEGDADRGIIAGILWNRITKGMLLQADAAPETYKNKGLPKNPICNPGLEAIKAAIYPVASPYLFYLHDKSGTIHYARTFAEHKLNVAKYLQKQ